MQEVKKKRVSKKTRKAWRKHVDTKDVDSFLEKARQNERLGNFALKKDSELFAIDTQPIPQSKSVKRMLLKSQEPKCFAILKERSAVPDPIVKRNRVRTKEERMNALLLKKLALQKAQGILKKKEKQALKDREKYEEKLEEKRKEKRVDFKQDVWSKPEKTEGTTESEWMTTDTRRHTLAHQGIRKRKVPSTLRKKTSMLPAIEPPHKGTSYNPSYEDHQSLLLEVAEKEQQLLKEEEHLNRVTSKMFSKVSREKREENRLKELSEGLNIHQEHEELTEEEEESNESCEMQSVNPAVKREKKTRQQRRKQREQRDLLRKLKEKKIEKKKTSDIYRLKHISKHLATVDQKLSNEREKRLRKKEEREKKGTKQLGKLKFEKDDTDFVMANEISGNLRNTAPVGSLLRDRFKSMQERNILAPSTMRKIERAKKKRFIKPDHKIDFAKIK